MQRTRTRTRTSTLPAISEREFMAQVRQLAALRGWLVYHTRDSRGSVPGFPDLCMVRGTRLIFAELKSQTGRLTPTQAAWLVALRQTEAEVYLWTSADWKQIERVLT